MKFDYRGILLRIKNTLEHIYLRVNCKKDFFVVMLVFDTRIERMRYSEYTANNLIRLVSTETPRAISAQDMIESSQHKVNPDETLSIKNLCKIFQGYCNSISNPIFSDIYPIYDADEFKPDSGASPEIGIVQSDAYLKGVIAVCANDSRSNPDDFLVKALAGFGGSFYEVVTREYLKRFASGVVNNVVSQAAALPANIVSAAGVSYTGFWSRLLVKPGGYRRYDAFADNINRIAELAYESAEACGRIIFSRHEFPDEYTLIKFKTPYKISSHTMVRKLLQIVDMGHSLGATNDSIYGIISDAHVEEYRLNKQSLFAVNFERERMWSITYLGNLTVEPAKVFLSEYEAYKYVEDKLDYDFISKQFADFSSSHIPDVFEIINSAVNGRHGTMLVFSKEAEAEISRLKSTCIPLKTPIDLGNGENSELVKFITSIDGAVFCDETGLCHAIGVILDGFSSSDDTSAEDISHGARHNSAHRYIRGHKGLCVIVVISEDGYISVIS